MKNQTQIAKQNAPSSRVRQTRHQAAGEGTERELSDGGAIFFDSTYDDIREKPFDEAICLFKALLSLIKHHPGMTQEREALRNLVRGDQQLQNCQAVKRSTAANN